MSKELFRTKSDGETFAFNLGDHGQERDLICTEEERRIFDYVSDMVGEASLDPSVLRLVRKSENYISIVMDSSGDYGAMDLARVKYTNRAKWIKFGPRFDRVDIDAPADVLAHPEEAVAAYRANEPYL